MQLRFLILFAAVSLAIPTGGAQSIEADGGRVPMATLPGPWRFHAGDDPRWSSATFDDSSWSLLVAGKPWSQQGYSSYAGVAWYRLTVPLPPHPGALSLDIPYVENSCQVFANGRLIGQVGLMPPSPAFYVEHDSLFPVPADAISQGHPLQLAVRVWLDPAYADSNSGGLITVPRIGDAAAMDEWHQLQIHDRFWHLAARSADVAINIFTALAGIGLFLLRRREREYLWWGVSQAFWAAFAGISLAANFFPTHYNTAVIASVTVELLAYYLQFVFYTLFLHQRRGVLFWIAVVATLSAKLLELSMSFGFARTGATPTLSAVLSLLAQAGVVGILYVGVRRRVRDAAILFIPNCVMLSCNVVETIASMPQFYNQHWAGWMRQFLAHIITWPFNIGAFQLVGDLEMLAVLVILLRRYARTRQDEERLESELEAARAVQKVLIPTEVPVIPGFSVETVYRPASQVGGDFFQIIPLPAGGALIAIGDVSGKGMPAAMTVSLLVGTLRTLAYYTQSPGEILAAMNRRMVSRSQGGFTTCLVVRLDPGGDLTIANAGHIAPYIRGKEIEIENGLPLGLAESATYAEITVKLDTNAQLTLLTDGVVEARNQSGELLGFERMRELSVQPASDVASAAQSFGQEDDITVLTLSISSAFVGSCA
jgi:hypothetical protein